MGFPKWRMREFVAWGEVWSPSLFAMQLKEPYTSSLRDFIWSNHAVLQGSVAKRDYESTHSAATWESIFGVCLVVAERKERSCRATGLVWT